MATSASPLTARAASPKTARPARVHAAGATRFVSRTEDVVLFLVAAFPLAALGLFAALSRGLYHVDALARSFTAVEVVRGYQPKLANLDLAWPPIPGLLQLPIAFLLPNITAAGGAGPLVSALSTALCVVLMNRIIAPRLADRPYRYLMLGLIFANPMVLGLAISGVTEMTALVFLLVAWSSFQKLMDGAAPIVPLAVMGLAIGCLIVSRFEAVLAAGLIAGLVVAFLAARRGPDGWRYVGAMFLAYAVPIVYVAVVFIFLSATITGNPFYFATGAGANTDYTRVIVKSTPQLAALVHDPVATVRYMTRASVSFAPLTILALPAAMVAAVVRRSLGLAAICVLTIFLPLTQFLLLLTGQSAGWSRYFFTNAIFLGPLLLWTFVGKPTSASARNLVRGVQRPSIAVVAILLGVLASDAYGWTRLDDATIRTDLQSSSGGNGFVSTLFGFHDAASYDPQIDNERDIAAALRETVLSADPRANIIVDASQATRIVLFSEMQNQFITQNVIGFKRILASPAGTARYLLVPDTLPERNLILQAYPGLFDGVYANLTMVAQFNGVFVDAGNTFYRWGLFEIAPDPPAGALKGSS